MKISTAIGALAMGTILGVSGIAAAQIVTGQAYIENGNTIKAKENARREAMRTFVEQQVGVQINAVSETENYILVRDRIVAKSDGFVIVKRVVDEQNCGMYYKVTLDLEAGTKPVATALADMQLDRNSSRASLDIAITDETADATWDWSTCFVASLKAAGYHNVRRNGYILQFLGNNLSMNKLQLYPELRRIGRMSGSTSKSIARGSIRMISPAQQLGSGAFVATAQASVEIIGYDADEVDAVSKYATAMGSSPAEAMANAKQTALAEVAQALAQQTVVTVQYEEQGGRREIETVLVFAGIYDRVGESKNILSLLEEANCEVDRSVFKNDGSFEVAVYTQEYHNLHALVQAVLDKLHTSYPGAFNTQYDDIGATKPIIRLRG